MLNCISKIVYYKRDVTYKATFNKCFKCLQTMKCVQRLTNN